MSAGNHGTHSHGGHSHSHGGGAGHAHGHSHDHSGTPMGPLVAALGITFVIFLAQVIGAWISGSLALLSDSMHMLSDSAALVIALIAGLIGQRAASARATYGYRRTEVLAALVNGLTVAGVTIWIVIQAIRRVTSASGDTEIDGLVMLIVAIVGMLANLASAVILWRHQASSMNVRAAFLHVLSDLIGSVFVIVAALFIQFFDFKLADVLASAAIVVMILPRALSLIRDAFRVLLEQVPDGFDFYQIAHDIRAIEGVHDIHDLHVWTTSGTDVLATCHVVVEDYLFIDGRMLDAVQKVLESHDIFHSTIQLEHPEHAEHEEFCAPPESWVTAAEDTGEHPAS